MSCMSVMSCPKSHLGLGYSYSGLVELRVRARAAGAAENGGARREAEAGTRERGEGRSARRTAERERRGERGEIGGWTGDPTRRLFRAPWFRDEMREENAPLSGKNLYLYSFAQQIPVIVRNPVINALAAAPVHII